MSRYPYACDYTSRLRGLEGKPVARGGFCVVRKCYLDDEPVAVKELWDEHHTSLSEVSVKEYELWRNLRHCNILPLKGICYVDPDREVASFVSPWQKNGRIQHYVHGKPDADYLNLIEGIAEGVRYLHDNGIVHGDLRGANILVSDDCQALVTDFGISKCVGVDGVTMSTEFRGNYRWMPYEFLHVDSARELSTSDIRRTKESDVWMFGMLIQEILSGEIPYHEYDCPGEIISMIQTGKLPVFPPAQHAPWRKFDAPIRALRLRCCALEPKSRPSLDAILDEIRDMRTLSTAVNSPTRYTPADIPDMERDVSSNIRFGSGRDSIDETVRLSDILGSLHLSGNVTPSVSRRTFSWLQESTGDASHTFVADSQAADFGSTTDFSRRSHPASPEAETAFIPDPYRAGSVTFPICPTVELNNYLARNGLTHLFTEEYSQYGPGEHQMWLCILTFNGKEIARAESWKKREAKRTASRIALTQLCGPEQAPFKNRSSSSIPTSQPQYREEGPDHIRTWICTIKNGNSVVEGRGRTKKEATQNARLRIS